SGSTYSATCSRANTRVLSSGRFEGRHPCAPIKEKESSQTAALNKSLTGTSQKKAQCACVRVNFDWRRMAVKSRASQIASTNVAFDSEPVVATPETVEPLTPDDVSPTRGIPATSQSSGQNVELFRMLKK